MSKFTPGPWRSWNTFGNKILNHWHISGAPIDGVSKSLATVSGSEVLSGDEQVANAQLIAAAPDLLAALQALVNVLSDDENDYADSQAYRQTMDQVAFALAAIAKATAK